MPIDFSTRLATTTSRTLPLVALLATSAAVTLLWPRPGGSLLERLGPTAAGLLLAWQIAIVLLILGAAAVGQAGLPRLPLLLPVGFGLVFLEAGSWFVLLALGRSLSREHLRFLIREAPRLFFVTTAGEIATGVGLLLGSLLTALLVLRIGPRIFGARPAHRWYLSLTVTALAFVAVGHPILSASTAPIRSRRPFLPETMGAAYRIHLSGHGLWLTQLLLPGPGLSLDAELVEEAQDAATGAPRQPPSLASPSMATPRPVLLVKIDSLRWDELAQTGGPPETMPHLSRLADEGVLFDRCYAPSAETAYSFPALMTAQYPLRRPYRDYHDDTSYPHLGLPDVLARVGYVSAFFTADAAAWQSMHRLIRPMAWDEYVEIFESQEALQRREGWWARVPADAEQRLREGPDAYDRLAVDFLLAWLEEPPDRPWFAVLDLIWPHYPYRWPAGSPPPFVPHDPERLTTFLHYPESITPVMRNAYRNALHATDAELDRAIRQLRSRHPDLLIVVTSDHGEAFRETGRVTHATDLEEAQIRLPLLFVAPGLSPALRPDACSLIDVNPTILGLLGLPPHPAMQGFDLFDEGLPTPRPIYATMQSPLARQDAVIFDSYKLVADRGALVERLYDLQADPWGKHNLADEHPEVLSALRQDLTRFRRSQLGYYAHRARDFNPPRYPEFAGGRWKRTHSEARPGESD